MFETSSLVNERRLTLSSSNHRAYVRPRGALIIVLGASRLVRHISLRYHYLRRIASRCRRNAIRFPTVAISFIRNQIL